MVQLKDHPLTQPDAGLDTTAYIALAQRVLGGNWTLAPGLYFVSPLYIYFLAAALAVLRSFTAVRLLQIVLGTAAVWLVYVAAKEWFGHRAAMFAAALAALTGMFTFYESLLIQAALDPFLTAAAMAALALGLRRQGLRWYVLSGAAFGIQMLNRPNVVIPACVIGLLLAVMRDRRPVAALSAGIAIALFPVAARNVVVAGNWSPASSHGGLNFYIGNSAAADGAYTMVSGITPNLGGQQEDARRIAGEALGHAVDDAGASRYFYSLGWKWIGEQPAAAAGLFLKKLTLVFGGTAPWLNYSYRFFAYEAQTPLRALFVGPWLLIPLGLAGLVIGAPAKDPGRLSYLIWASFVPLYAIAVAVFFVADRYTLPLLVPLCASAGATLDRAVAVISARRWGHVAVAGVAIVTLFAWVNRPRRIDDGVGEERTRMAERLITLGRYGEAEQWGERAAQVYPRPGLVHFRLGQRLLVAGQSAAAMHHFEEALRFDAGQPEVEFMLGEALLEQERPQESIAHLRRAVDAGFRRDEAGYDLVRALGAIGDRDEAIRMLRSIRPARDDDGDRWTALGELAMQLREPVLAETLFSKAVAVRPSLASAHFGLAAAEATMGHASAARLHADEAVRLDPGSDRARQLRQALK